MSYPAPDSKVYVTVTKWDGKCLIAIDANTNQYIHWLEDDKRWEKVWRAYVGKENLVLLARVGRSDGPRGRKMFVVNVEPAFTLPQPEPTRSPLDVFTAKGLDVTPLDRQLDATVDAIKRRPKSGHVASRHVTFEPYAVAFLEDFQRKTGCKNLKEAAHKCVRMAMAYDS